MNSQHARDQDDIHAQLEQILTRRERDNRRIWIGFVGWIITATGLFIAGNVLKQYPWLDVVGTIAFVSVIPPGGLLFGLIVAVIDSRSERALERRFNQAFPVGTETRRVAAEILETLEDRRNAVDILRKRLCENPPPLSPAEEQADALKPVLSGETLSLEVHQRLQPHDKQKVHAGDSYVMLDPETSLGNVRKNNGEDSSA